MYSNCIILYNLYLVFRSPCHPVLTINSAASRKASLVSFDRLPMKENGSTSGVQSRWKRHESNCSFTLSTAHRCLLLYSHHRWPCHLHNSFHCPCQQPKTSGVTAPQHWMFCNLPGAGFGGKISIPLEATTQVEGDVQLLKLKHTTQLRRFHLMMLVM